VTSDFEWRFAATAAARRQRRDGHDVSEHRLQVDRFRGRLNLVVDFRDLSSHLKLDGWPEVRQPPRRPCSVLA